MTLEKGIIWGIQFYTTILGYKILLHTITFLSSGGFREVSGILTETPFEISEPLEDLMEDALKLKFLEGSAMPLFRSGGTSLPGHRH